MLPDSETRSMTVAALNADVETLRNVQESLEDNPVKAMFEATIATLVLVRDEMVEEDALVELVQCCASACLVSRNVTKGRGAGGLSEPAQNAIESMEKILDHIQSEVAQHAPGAKFLPGYLPGLTEMFPTQWKADLQKALEDVNRCMEAEASPVSGNEQCAQPPANNPPPSIVTTQSNVDLTASTEPPDPGEQALQRLISGAIPQEELALTIEAAFSNEKAIEMVDHLQASEAQAFVEAIDEVLERPDFPPHIRNGCLRSLYRVCARHSLLPRSLQIELGENLTGAARCNGGFGDVWKHEYQGQQVAVKVLKMYESDDLRKVTRRFCKEFITWKSLRHPNMLPLLGVVMSENRFAMVSEWMPNGNIKEYVKAHESVNRFELLRGVAEGLVYMHERGMVHGDLKGKSILIDENGRPRLANFDLIVLKSDAVITSTSEGASGTLRWMSPELLDPEEYSLKHSCPTEDSDCWALGMVVYEVLSGNVPFHRHNPYAVVAKILQGRRPARPPGAWFNDDVWNIMEGCWKPSPRDRSKTADVLRCLEKVSESWSPPQAMNLDSGAEDSTDESEKREHYLRDPMPVATSGNNWSTESTPSATAAMLNRDVEILIAAQESLKVPTKAVLEAAVDILFAVRDEMIDDDAFVELARTCARACLVLKTVTDGVDMGDLSESTQGAIGSLEKTVRHIRSKVVEEVPGASSLSKRRPWSAEVFLTRWQAELQKILEVIDEKYEQWAVGRKVESRERDLRRLVSGNIPQSKLVSSIEAVLSSREAIDMVYALQRSDAKAFIDAVSEALERPGIPQLTRNKCLKLLYGTCAGHSLLPRSLQIELSVGPTGAAPCQGGFGDVWRCEYRGRQVAVKVLRMRANNDMRKVTRRFCKESITWKFLRHPNLLPLLGAMISEDRFTMVSEWMPNGDINQFVKAHKDVNRFKLLTGVTEGLVYMHEQGTAHGDLKGANILIDKDGHARLADFGLLAIISEGVNLSSSNSLGQAGTYRWMSPELLDPEEYSLKHSCPTEHSDCYALGMVLYEVLSGNVPFHCYHKYTAIAKILKGERPARPPGGWFNDDVWDIMEGCWKPNPRDRSKTTDVLRCLEKISDSWLAPLVMNLDSSPEGGTDASHAAPSWSRISVLSPDDTGARELRDPVIRGGSLGGNF